MIERIRTRITDILDIRYPILQAGMVWAAGYRLAAACSEAGILGTIGSAGMNLELLRSQIRKARALTEKRMAVIHIHGGGFTAGSKAGVAGSSRKLSCETLRPLR